MYRTWLSAAALLVCTQLAIADTVSLNNGDKITGTITEVNPKQIIVETPYAGKLTIDRTAIKTMQSEKTVTVVEAEGPKKELFLSPTADGKAWQETAAYVPPPPATPPRHTSWLMISPDWTNHFEIGVLNTTGNDETTSVAGALTFHYLKKPDELTLAFSGAYGVSNGTQNAGFFDQNAVYRHDIVANKLYGYVDDDVRYDAIKGISLLATGTGGLGYWLVNTDKFKVDARGGFGVTYQKLFDGESNTSPAAEAGLRMEYIFNERVSATENADYVTSLTDGDIWHLDSETALKVMLDLERGLSLKFAFIDNYANQPSAGLKNNDTRLTLTIGLDF